MVLFWFLQFEDKSIVRHTGSRITDAVLTRVGVFVYEDGAGGFVRVLRPPEEVFKAESLASLRLVPLTLLHPPAGEVNPDTFRDSAVIGTVSNDVRVDGENIVATVAVHDRIALEAHAAGIKQLSCGYNADRVSHVEGVTADGAAYSYNAPGIWTDSVGNDHSFDLIQTNIIYNHVAQLPAGRAGNARFLDAAAGHDMADNVSPDTSEGKGKLPAPAEGSSEPILDAGTVKLTLGDEEFSAPSLAAAMGMLQAMIAEGGGAAPEASESSPGSAEEPSGEEVAEQLAATPEDAFPVGLGKKEGEEKKEEDSAVHADAAAITSENASLRKQLDGLRSARVLDSVGPFLEGAGVQRPADLCEAVKKAIQTKIPGSPVDHLDSVASAFAAWQVVANIPATAAPVTTNDADTTDSRARADAAWVNGAPPLTRK